ncbi:Protein yippee-like F37A8,5 [Caenorhabditis elegans] [Rhizoctonia solani]|uniref:Protein yippee-like n=1 Tax=Rhizoctonia solani TaxID=456999 RepID=A0A0K6GBZ8_9AGAM|nr:Protein yippee-like F37A8,5 [Caenorhabditis elegans] [Rhizoctonia solani]
MPSRRNLIHANTDPTEVVSIFHDQPCYYCLKCSAPLALQDELVSKSFSGREGAAYLMHSVINVKIGKSEGRQLLTGYHTVADIYCIGCGTTVGWTYLKAHELSQKYKEGKYIVEKERIVKENAWSIEEP